MHPDVAVVYDNMAVSYLELDDYEQAIIYLNKSIKIYEKVFGEDNVRITNALHNLAISYKRRGNYKEAISCYEKAAQIRIKYYGEKHPKVAKLYNNMSVLYLDMQEFKKALEMCQKSLIAQNINIPIDDYESVPLVKDIEHKAIMHTTLDNRAVILAYGNTKEGYINSVKNLMVCDTLVTILRNSVASKNDKLNISMLTDELSRFAVESCIRVSELSLQLDSINEYKELAFDFSEKNKANILYEALVGSEAKRFAGVPESILEEENNINSYITYYNEQLNFVTDSTLKAYYRIKLFTYKRKQDSLLDVIENQYPKYHNLKYSVKPYKLDKAREMIDDKTAILSYTLVDSLVTIYTITKNDLIIQSGDTINNFSEVIDKFRKGLVYNSSERFANIYRKLAFRLYKKLIPRNLGPEIENLIIIPDKELALIPFETLLSKKTDEENWADLPYLIKDYNISYSYSLNLFIKTHPKSATKEIETTGLNDWIAFAPVFDSDENASITLRTRESLRTMDSVFVNNSLTRGSLIRNGYITPLPGTYEEVNRIFEEFNKKNKKAVVKLKNGANEEFIKSGSLENFKYIHFATHGFVDTDKPELSGLLLAQDSTSEEDGILHSGEIYNLRMNSELTVLSACETGLGKISEGEGIIGLTRALLYAGTKNIVVSLWSVSDESTTDLMINFYDNILNDNSQDNYSNSLRKAKLNMINQGKFAHPFYWSPFILIGK